MLRNVLSFSQPPLWFLYLQFTTLQYIFVYMYILLKWLESYPWILHPNFFFIWPCILSDTLLSSFKMHNYWGWTQFWALGSHCYVLKQYKFCLISFLYTHSVYISPVCHIIKLWVPVEDAIYNNPWSFSNSVLQAQIQLFYRPWSNELNFCISKHSTINKFDFWIWSKLIHIFKIT